MDLELIQRTRYVLRARFRNPQRCHENLFNSACLQLINWIDEHQILSTIFNSLKIRCPEIHKSIIEISTDENENSQYLYNNLIKTSFEHSAMCAFIIQAIGNRIKEHPENKNYQYNTLYNINYFLTQKIIGKQDEILSNIRDIALDGLYEYLDEQLDTRNALYGLLIKYKQRSEWFYRDRLNNIIQEGLEGKKGERALVLDLYQYVHDQGVEFFIEPKSPNDMIDLLLRAPEGRYILIDGKYLSEGSSNSEIVKKISDGFHQVYKYCELYNENEGFLVTFNATKIRIALEIDTMDDLQYMKMGGKIIYHLFINISDEPSASKLGIAEELIIKKNKLKK